MTGYTLWPWNDIEGSRSRERPRTKYIGQILTDGQESHFTGENGEGSVVNEFVINHYLDCKNRKK